MKEGTLGVIYGPMFAGKSTKLIEMAYDAQDKGFGVAVYSPAMDTRYGVGVICNHPKSATIDSVPVDSSLALLSDLTTRREVSKVFVDEAQFFDKEMPEVIRYIVQELEEDVILAGLLHDFRGEVFGPMGELIKRARWVISLASECTYIGKKPCKNPAYFTQRLVDGEPANYDSPIILVGGNESYTARCQEHWQIPGRPRININTLLS